MNIDTKLQNLRLKYKKLYETKFNEFVQNIKYQLPAFNSFEISLFKPHHREEVLTLLSYSFSILSNDQRCVIFHRNVIDEYKKFETFVDDSLKYGRSIVLIDSNNHVAALLFTQDMCDKVKKTRSSIKNKYTLRQKHGEIYDCVDNILYNQNTKCIPIKHDDMYKMHHKRYKDLNELESLYGKYEWTKMICVRPDVTGLNLSFFLNYVNFQILDSLGYKYQISRTSNPRNISGYKRRSALCLIEYDYQNHVFKDGTNMDNIFNEMKQKYLYNDNHIDAMKKGCKISVWIMERNKTFQAFAQRMRNYNAKHSKL